MSTPEQGGGSPRALRWLGIGLVVLVIVLAWSFRSLSPHTPGEDVSLDEALRLAQAGRVETATFLDHDSRLLLSVSEDEQVWAAYPADGAQAGTLIEVMVEAGATVEVDQQWGKRTLAAFSQFILPLLILADLFGIFILLARGGASQVKDLFAFSKMQAEQADASRKDRNPYHFKRIGALDEAIVELAEVKDYLANPRRFAAMGALPPKGVLLYGPPGCGKTLLARALAGEARVPFYFISGSEFVESLVGVGAARVRDLFQQAIASAPAIVFIDELDAAGRKRGAGIGGGHDEREQTLNELLVQMDGFTPTQGVVVIGASNRPDILDPALLRPGRFDRHVGIDLPDLEGRREILELHAASRPFGPDADLGAAARLTHGFTGADLANVVNEAALLAVRRRGRAISMADLAEGVERALAGPRQRGSLLTEDELLRLAYHEAGHVVVAAAVEFPAEITRVSIVARGANAAHSAMLRSDRTIFTRSELLGEMTAAMGGIAAEELSAGEPSTAGERDVERATDLARQFAGRYGMSETVGRIRVIQKDAEVFLGRDYLLAASLSPQTTAQIDEAVRGLVDEAEERALQILQKRRKTLDALAEALMDKETVDEAELSALLSKGTRRSSRKGAAKAP